MAETFLRRWFGGKPTAPAADEARAEIDRLLADRPSYRGPLTWLRAIADDLVPVPGFVTVELPGPEAARDKLLAGIPLLRGEKLAVDAAEFARRWERAVDALKAGPPPVGRGRLDAGAVASALVNGDAGAIAVIAERVGADPGRVATIARFVLFAGFVHLEASAAESRRGVPWDRGFCPTCGGPPLLAEFRGLDQSRVLRCGLCAASWEVPRQWCPACGNRDHELLGLLAREGEDARYRVATCDRCRSGVKTLSTPSTLPPLMLLVADTATLHLDLAAADRGYQCPPASSDPAAFGPASTR